MADTLQREYDSVLREAPNAQRNDHTPGVIAIVAPHCPECGGEMTCRTSMKFSAQDWLWRCENGHERTGIAWMVHGHREPVCEKHDFAMDVTADSAGNILETLRCITCGCEATISEYNEYVMQCNKDTTFDGEAY